MNQLNYNHASAQLQLKVQRTQLNLNYILQLQKIQINTTVQLQSWINYNYKECGSTKLSTMSKLHINWITLCAVGTALEG